MIININLINAFIYNKNPILEGLVNQFLSILTFRQGLIF